MARIRALKIGFFKDEELASWSFAHRLLFAGLWCLADREGRLEDRPRWIKSELFPYDDGVDVSAILQDLAKGPDPFVVRYVVDGKGYLWIRKFRKHQRPHHTEGPSEYPQPPQLLASAPESLRSVGAISPEPSRECQGGNGEWGMGNGVGNGVGAGEREEQPADDPPVWRPPTAKRDPGLYDGRDARLHGCHAFCGRLCVSLGLDADFQHRLGGVDAKARLQAWYPTVLARFTGVVIGDDVFQFWRNEFAAWVGTVTAKPTETRESRTLAAARRSATSRGELP